MPPAGETNQSSHSRRPDQQPEERRRGRCPQRIHMHTAWPGTSSGTTPAARPRNIVNHRFLRASDEHKYIHTIYTRIHTSCRAKALRLSSARSMIRGAGLTWTSPRPSRPHDEHKHIHTTYTPAPAPPPIRCQHVPAKGLTNKNENEYEQNQQISRVHQGSSEQSRGMTWVR